MTIEQYDPHNTFFDYKLYLMNFKYFSKSNVPIYLLLCVNYIELSNSYITLANGNNNIIDKCFFSTN